MAEGVRCELLGPLRVLGAPAGGRGADGARPELPLGPPRQRAVLAVLLLQEGRTLSFQALVDAVWGPDSPGQVRNLVQKYVSGIRRALAPESGPDAGGPRLLWTGSGYGLTGVAVHDLHERADLVAAAVAARDSGDLTAAVDLAGRAEGLWRGEFAEGLGGPFLAAERARWAEKRLVVMEARLDGLVRLERYQECVHELVRQVAAHPLRERLIGLLMLAQYRSGQSSVALRTFAQARERIAEEMGSDPGPELRRLHQRMLRQDPDLLPGSAVAS